MYIEKIHICILYMLKNKYLYVCTYGLDLNIAENRYI